MNSVNLQKIAASVGLIEWVHLMYENQKDIVFEESQEEDSDKNKQLDQTA